MQNKSLGNITSLYISKKDFKNRIEQSRLILKKNGVVEDKYYAKDIQRSVLISSVHGYQIVKKQGIDINYGELGENIIVDFDINQLQLADNIRIGEVELKITQNCTICQSLAKIDPKVPKLLKNDRGIFAKVIKNGIIKKDDAVMMQN